MRILVVGAGGIGGYFGARLLEAKRDVTFLVRKERARLLAANGLNVESPLGNIAISSPSTVTADALAGPYDLVILSCKAYDLEQAMADFAPAVGPATLVLPLLNGMRHLDILDNRFGAANVLGGLALISVVLSDGGLIRHLSPLQKMTVGARLPEQAAAFEAVGKALADAGFDLQLEADILQAMWEKWVFIATAAALTALMRGPVGDIVAAGGSDIAVALLNECAGIARCSGYAPSQTSLSQWRSMFTDGSSALTASLFRDIEGGGRIEADHLIGDLLRREEVANPISVLRVAYVHMKTYEARRAREAAIGSAR